MHTMSSSFPSSYSPVLLQLHLISQPCLSQAISPCLLFINSLLFSTPSLASLLSPPFFHISPLCSFFFCLFLTVFFLWVDEKLGRCGGLHWGVSVWPSADLERTSSQFNSSQPRPPGAPRRSMCDSSTETARRKRQVSSAYMHVCLCVRVSLLKLMPVCEKEECV